MIETFWSHLRLNTENVDNIPDTFRVLPHRDIRALLGPPRAIGRAQLYEHGPCSMTLSQRDVKEANWCPYCTAIINKAARRRGQAAIASLVELGENAAARLKARKYQDTEEWASCLAADLGKLKD